MSLMMALKLASLARGASGVRLDTVLMLEAMLARGLTPLIPTQGSVGASGDLAPLSHLAAAMMGVGEIFYAGERMAAADALARAGAEAAFNDYEAAILAALAETESAFAAQARAQEQLVELTEAERASVNAANLARLRYENGATNFLSVLDADRRDIEAADRLAAARTSTVRAQVAVFRALRAGPQIATTASNPVQSDVADSRSSAAPN